MKDQILLEFRLWLDAVYDQELSKYPKGEVAGFSEKLKEAHQILDGNLDPIDSNIIGMEAQLVGKTPEEVCELVILKARPLAQFSTAISAARQLLDDSISEEMSEDTMRQILTVAKSNFIQMMGA